MFESSYTIEKKKTGIAATQVKFFTDSDPMLVERSLNEWLRQNEVEIRHIGQSQSEKGGRLVFVVSVFY